MKSYGAKHKCTKVFLEWLKNASTIQGADSSVKVELNKFKEAIERLVAGSMLVMNEQIAQVYAKGFSVTSAYGAGSAGGDGKALFATDHPIKKTGGTFSNRAAAGQVLSAANLEAAILAYKTNVKTANGYRIKLPEVFDLLVPRVLETSARKILNSNGDQAGVYAGTGTNANLLNVFSFQGSKVRLTVVDMIGELAADGTTIGNDAMWFLLNKEYALRYKAFRVFRLWSNEITSWVDNETDAMFTKITTHFGVDFYNPECVYAYAGD